MLHHAPGHDCGGDGTRRVGPYDLAFMAVQSRGDSRDQRQLSYGSCDTGPFVRHIKRFRSGCFQHRGYEMAALRGRTLRNKSARLGGPGAYDMLLKEIENGDLPPGTRLREAELAERIGISRTPVREALKRLESQGLVAHEPHHGTVVATLDYGEVAELYQIREVLEGTAARLGAQSATEAEIGVLQKWSSGTDRSLQIPNGSAKVTGNSINRFKARRATNS